MRRVLAVPVLLLAVGVAASGTLRAQAPRAEPPPSFGSEVAVVTLPVFVTDKSGTALGGLKQEDFEVTDEGKPVSIVGFLEVDAAKPPLEGVSWATAAAARRQFLLLFDLSFSPVQGIVRARTAAREFLEKGLAPADLVAVGTVSTKSGFKLLVGFTPDREQAARAVETLGVTHTQVAPDPLGLAFELGAPSSISGAAGPSGGELGEELRLQAQALQRSEQAQYNERVVGFLATLQQIGQALDSVQGRKQIVLLSGGFDQSALVGAQGAEARESAKAVTEGRLWEVSSDGYFGDTRSRQGMDGLFRVLGASDTVIHTVDVGGLGASGDIQQGYAQTGNAQGGTMRAGAGREALTSLANQSGGRLVKDTNDLAGALGEIADASRRYYVLAFEPLSKEPGKLRKLKVKVKSKGVQVSHRAGYVPTARAREAAAGVRRLRAAEAIAKGGSGGPIDLRVVAVPYRDRLGKVSVPVVLEVDGRTLLDRGPGNELKLEVYAYAFDAQGSIRDVTAFSPTFDLAKVGEKLRQKGLHLQTSFALAEGTHDLRFLVRDTSTGRTGLRRVSVDVPSFGAGQVVVHPPHFMDDPGAWLSLKVPSRNNAEPDMPFRVQDDLFTPLGKPRLVNGTPSRVCVMVFNGGSLDPKATFEIGSQLLDAAGATVPLGTVALTKAVLETDGFRRYVLSVTPGTVAPGDYTFRIRLTDATSGAVTESDRPVRVE